MSFWVGLDKGCEDLGMLPKVLEEGVAAPASHDLHDLHWHPLEQVKKGGTYAYAMALKRLQTGLTGSYSQALDEGRLGERTKLAFVLTRQWLSRAS